jgi:hypothetical protein
VSATEGVRVERPVRTVPDRLLGLLGGAMLLLALVVLIRGGESDDGGRPLGPPPAVRLLEPAPGTALTGPLAVVFELDGELRQMSSGWGVEGYHLHLQLDGLELMPAPGDITELPDKGYRWTVGRLEPGPHTLKLFWADASHVRVPEGGSEVVEVQAS